METAEVIIQRHSIIAIVNVCGRLQRGTQVIPTPTTLGTENVNKACGQAAKKRASARVAGEFSNAA
jgi:hypothetical protein